ncbi:MAG: hypothetical protein AMXMBFR47_36220 [Planctomycetota bacterium]
MPLVVSAAHVALALQQEPNALKWSRSVPAVIATAKETRRPILMLVEGTEAGRRRQHLYSHNDIEQRENTLSDPRVAYAARMFVPVAVNRTDRAYAGMFVELGVGLHTPYRILVISPEGAKLGDFLIAPNPADLARELARTIRAYGRNLFETELKAKLDDPGLPAGELKAVLQMVRDFSIDEAENCVIDVLERPQLEPAIRRLGYDGLAAVSTEGAVEFLLDRSATAEKADARAAAAALAQCTRAGAEHLLGTLEKPEERDRFLEAYRAIVRICGVPAPKADRFWQGDNKQVQSKEIRRVKALATESARNWKARFGDYR